MACLPLCAGIPEQSIYQTPYTFTTLAGKASIGKADGSGSAAGFYLPLGLAVDAKGNVFIADTENHLIRKVTPKGGVTTLAGSGQGYGNGKGRKAMFSRPSAVATKGSKYVYVADSANHVIRRIRSSGAVELIAGAPLEPGSADGKRSKARFSFPSGIAVKSDGTVYVADTGNHTIRKISAAGRVTTLAGVVGQSGGKDGTGAAARFNEPRQLALDAKGNLYVTDGTALRKVTPSGKVSTLATDFSSLGGVCVTPKGEIFVSDANASVVALVKSAGAVEFVAGSEWQAGTQNGVGSSARFDAPGQLAWNGPLKSLVLVDTRNHLVRKVSPARKVTTLAGRAGRGAADGTGSKAQFDSPMGITVKKGNVYVADAGNHIIRSITAKGKVKTWSGTQGEVGNENGKRGVGTMYFPNSLVFASNGSGYVADASCRVRKISASGVTSSFVGQPQFSGFKNGKGIDALFTTPHGLAIDKKGNIYVTDTDNHVIRKVTPSGKVTTFAGTPGVAGDKNGSRANALFNQPWGIAIDAEQNLYVSDFGSHTIRKISIKDRVSTFAGAANEIGNTDGQGSVARFVGPRGIALDKRGNLYVCDSGNGVIRRIAITGSVTTIAGLAGEAGDQDGTGKAARFRYPCAIAVDSKGVVYVADQGNDTIRRGVVGGP